MVLAAAAPGGGVEAGRRLFGAGYQRDGFPEPRGGLHHGPVVARDGDYFGATVNLAARVASRAGSGQALGTATVADAARAAGIDTVALGQHSMRNVLDPVELWAIELCPTHIDLSIDPVCRVRVSCQAAIGRIRHAGTEHWLCSLACVSAFAADPDRYLTASGADQP